MGNMYNFREKPPALKVGKRPKVLRELVVSRAANGGHVVKHRFDNDGPGPYIEPEEHVFGASEGGKVLAHITKHLGLKVGGAQANDAAEAGA